MILQEVILRTALCSLPGDGFIFPVGQDQDRSQRGRLEKRVKRLDALTIRQKQIEQDRGNSRLLQPGDALGEPPDPFQAPFVVG